MDNLTQHIQYPQHIIEEDVIILDILVQEHPYFQTAQLLLVKGLLNTESVRYSQQLKKAATYSLNRKQLFRLITQDIGNEKSITIEDSDNKNTKNDLAIDQPLTFQKGEEHSFSKWLVLSQVRKI
ncbi:hypothetical protein OAK24_02400, partial [Flavobacteriales bacterium]|nr:hypothetical protein [Flavobacteriales bacterium]